MANAKKKAKRPSRVEQRRRYWAVLKQILGRHVSAAWKEAAEYVGESNPNLRVKQYNRDFCDALIGEFNSRRDWSKVIGKAKS